MTRRTPELALALQQRNTPSGETPPTPQRIQTCAPNQEAAQVLAQVFGFNPPPNASDLRGAIEREAAAEREKQAAYAKSPKRAAAWGSSPKVLADRAARETRFDNATRAHKAAQAELHAATLDHGRAAFAPMLRPFIRAAVEALPTQEWVRVGDQTLRALMHLDVDGGTVTFDLLAVFDKMGLLQDLAVYRFTEENWQRERRATMDLMTYLAWRCAPSFWDLVWHLRSGDRLSEDHRSWSMDTRAGFALSPSDAQALAQMGEKMTALLGTLDALKMPNIALLEMAAADHAAICAGVLAPCKGDYLARLEQAFPACEARTHLVRYTLPTQEEAKP